MNEITKKIFMVSGMTISFAALLVAMMLFREHASLVSKIDSISLHTKLALREPKPEPTRIVTSTSGSNWLDVQKKVKDTVVQIYATVTEFNWTQPYKTPGQSAGYGSGFFISNDGYIISNYHVIAQATNVEIRIPFFGMQRFEADIIGVAPERDIALLKLKDESFEKITQRLNPLPFLELGDSDDVLRSQEVLALGYPLGQTRLKSTLGIVSGRERLGSFGYIQITAPLNPGNSGGPSVDTQGNVVGINSRGIQEAQNVGYFIPINEVKSALNDLYKVKLLRKPTLGCFFNPTNSEMIDYLNNPKPGGWYIAQVFENTLLENVGVKSGDMLYEINGLSVDRFGEMSAPWSEDKISLLEYMNRLTIGDKINFVVYRKGSRKDFNFTLEHKHLPPIRTMYAEFEPEAKDYEIIGGMVVMNLNLNHMPYLLQQAPNLIKYGKIENQYNPAIVITHILPNSEADKAHILKRGEVIQEVNGQKVTTLHEFRQATMKSKHTGYLTVKVDDNFYAVLSVDKLAKEENLLAQRYFFQPSPLVEELRKA